MYASLLHLPKAICVARVLKPHGRLCVGVKKGNGEGWEEKAWAGQRCRRFMSYFQPSEMEALLGRFFACELKEMVTAPDRSDGAPVTYLCTKH